MASPEKRHCVDCIGTLSFPIEGLSLDQAMQGTTCIGLCAVSVYCCFSVNRDNYHH